MNLSKNWKYFQTQQCSSGLKSHINASNKPHTTCTIMDYKIHLYTASTKISFFFWCATLKTSISYCKTLRHARKMWGLLILEEKYWLPTYTNAQLVQHHRQMFHTGMHDNMYVPATKDLDFLYVPFCWNHHEERYLSYNAPKGTLEPTSIHNCRLCD